MHEAVSAETTGSARLRTFQALSRFWPWASKSALAVVDQFLNSGSNFLLTILLARWLSAEAYGGYALAFSIYLLGISLQQALVTEPMVVFGPSTYREDLPRYLGVLLWVNMLVAFGFAAILGLCALAAHAFSPSGGLAGAFAGLGIATAFNFIFQWVRRALYLDYRVAEATAGSAVYSLLLVCGTWLVYRSGALSSFSAFLVMGIVSFVSSAFLLSRLKPSVSRGPSSGEVWRRHWDYGRWVVGTSAVKWLPSNSFYLLTGTLLGMADVGILKALLNMFLPLGQAANSLSLVFQPYVSSIFGRKGTRATRTPVCWITLVFLAGGLLYFALLAVFARPVFHLLYGGKFMQSLHLVPWVAAGGALVVVSYGPAIGLRAIQSPSSVFAVYCAAGVVSVLSGFLLTWAFGLTGAVGAWVASDLSTVLFAAWIFQRKVGRRVPGQSVTAEQRCCAAGDIGCSVMAEANENVEA